MSPHRRPFMAAVECDHAVSICASVRISDAVHCAGVETRTDHRQKAHAVTPWQVGAAGAISHAVPFYSTSWDNVASQGSRVVSSRR